MRSSVVAFIVIIALLAGGFFAYEYVKEKPPAFLIKWFTQTEPPPPLPAGGSAPLTVPKGFQATIFSRNVPGARVMTRDPKGAMLVSLTSEGKVVALPDTDSNGEADRTVMILEGLKQPHGIFVHCPDTGSASANKQSCVLYVAETNALKSYAYDADTFTARYQKTLATFPSGSGHFTRTLLMHPDGERLLVSIGSSCNVCNESNALRASVQTINIQTGEMTPFATGLRNTVFMALHPVTGEVWGTDNGRDLIGDDIPPDEVNIIEKSNEYGWPICYGKNIHDTDFDDKQYIRDPCGGATPSHIDLQSHSAALGLAFIPEEGWPEELWHDLLIAYHGSWNRSEPTGYKVVRIDLDNKGGVRSPAPADFVTGFLVPGQDVDDAIGRPVGLMAEPGGILYVSDDRAGAIYRIAVTASL